MFLGFFLAILWTYLNLANGQCAITEATISLEKSTKEAKELSNRNSLVLVIRGQTTGGRVTNTVWKRDNITISRSTNVSNGSYFDGGGEIVFNHTDCARRIYRVALLVMGYLPGEYLYLADNMQTPYPIRSPVFLIQDPGPPSNLTARQISNRRLQVTWDPPSSNLSGAISYYYYQETPDYITGGIKTNDTTITTSSFSLGHSYYIHVRATTGTYLSVPATSETITVADLLSPMVNHTASNTSVSLIMFQPSNSLPADMYTVMLSSTACPDIESTSATTTTNSITVNQLESGIQYNVTITAANTLAELMVPTVINIKLVEAKPSGSPGVPTVREATATSITILWTEISCKEKNGLIVEYKIRYSKMNTFPVILDHQSTNTSRKITGLNPFTAYTFAVSGITGQGTGIFSNEAVFSTNEDRPTSVRNLAGEAKLFSIILTWDVPVPLNGIIHNYTIRYSVGNNRTLTQSVDTMFTISNLRPSTEVYNITVWARTGGGDGPAEVQPTITTLKSPDMVANLSLQVLSVNSVRVSWSRVNDDAVTQYILYYGQLKIDLQEKQVTVPSSADSAVIRDVGEGTYKFEVVTQAQTDSGELWQSGRSHSIVLAIVSSNSSTPSPISNTMVVVITGAAVFIVTFVVYSLVIITVRLTCCRHKKTIHLTPRVTDSEDDYVETSGLSSQVMQLTNCKGPENVFEYPNKIINPIAQDSNEIYEGVY